MWRDRATAWLTITVFVFDHKKAASVPNVPYGKILYLGKEGEDFQPSVGELDVLAYFELTTV